MTNGINAGVLISLWLAVAAVAGTEVAPGKPGGDAAADDKAKKLEAKKKEGEKEAGGGAAKEQEQPYHVEADVTEGYTTGGERVLHGIGHVVIVHGDTTINCDEVYSYEAKHMSTLIGNVRIVDKIKKYTLTSGYAEYYEEKKFATATKSPVLVIRKDREVTITGDMMQMWTGEEYGEAVGNVHLISKDVEGDGGRLKYFGKEDRIELTGTPVVRQNDSRLAGDLITLYLEGEQAKRAVVDGQARLIYFSRPEEKKPSRDEARAAKIAEGAAAEEVKEGAPPEGGRGPEEAVPPAPGGVLPEGISAGTGGRSGEGFSETLPGYEAPPPPPLIEPPAVGPEETSGVPPETDPGSSEAVLAVEEAPAGGEKETEENPTGRVEAAGNKMVAEFAEGKIQTVDVLGNAEGHYWPFDELGRETGEQTDTRGDTIRVFLAAGEVKKILVDGNAEGFYRPAATEGRKGVTETAGDHMTVYVRDNGVRRIVVEGHARGSYYTEEAPPAEQPANQGEKPAPSRPGGKKG